MAIANNPANLVSKYGTSFRNFRSRFKRATGVFYNLTGSNPVFTSFTSGYASSQHIAMKRI
jgi:hypothetical protein